MRADLLEPRDLRLAHRACCRCRARRSRSPRASRYLFTPTITSSPRSMRAWRRVAHSSMRSFGMPASIALRHAAERLDLGDQLARLARRRSRSGDSMKYEPPHGSITCGMPVSSCEDQLRVARDARRARRSAAPTRLVEARWCAATACRRRPRPSPRSSCGSRCSSDPAR